MESGRYAITPKGKAVAEAVRLLFCELVGRDVSFDELSGALFEMRQALGERQLDDDEAMRFLIRWLRALPVFAPNGRRTADA